MSIKISALPAASAANTTDQHEVNQTGTSRRLTNQQIYDLIAALLSAANPLSLGGGNVQISPDGSISFAAGAVQMFGDGSIVIGAVPFSQIFLNNDGSETVDGSLVAGSVAVGTPPAAQINNNGSAFFLGASQTIRFDPTLVTGGFIIDLGDRAGNDFQVTLEGHVIGADAIWDITPIGDASLASITIGGGTKVTKVLSTTGVLDFGSTAAGASTDLTIALAGAALGDCVILGVPNGSTLANGVFSAWVSAANTVKVRFTNTNLVTALDPASGTFRVTVMQF